MRVLLFGGSGLLGQALQPALAARRYAVVAPPHSEVDCREPTAVTACVRQVRPDAVVIAAAKVGGLLANLRHGAEYLYDNALINLVTLKVCAELGVPRALVLGGSCIYPCDLERPIREEDLLTGPLESSSESYAVAKIAAVRYANQLYRQGRCRAVAAILTNLYGDHDHFDAEEGHLIASLLVKCHEATRRGEARLALWGDGTPRRDCLHAEDAARAVVALLDAPEPPDTLNVGSGTDAPVREIAQLVAEVVGFRGRLVFTGQAANGVMRKLLAIDRISALGWRPRITLKDGIQRAYRSFLAQRSVAERVHA